METIGYILATITGVYVWVDHLWLTISRRKTSLGYELRNKFMEKLDVKPINCAICLCSWTAGTLFYLNGDIFLLSLPLFYKLLYRIL